MGWAVAHFNFRSSIAPSRMPRAAEHGFELGAMGIHALKFCLIAALTREHGGWEQARLRTSDEHSRVRCLVPARLIGKTLPPTVRLLYTKWLRFYWDFCHKYRHDSLHPRSLPLFLRKLQDKHQSEQQQKQAQHAVSLFCEMQTAPLRSSVNTETG